LEADLEFFYQKIQGMTRVRTFATDLISNDNNMEIEKWDF
jgi:hypothetical protein